MVWTKIKDCLPGKFKYSVDQSFEIILKNWENLADKNISNFFVPDKLTKKGILVLRKINEIGDRNFSGDFNELKKKLNSFLGKEFIKKIKFF